MADWFTVSGSIMAFILFILKIEENRKDRIKLKIDIKSAFFNTSLVNALYDNVGTKIELLVDIRNEENNPQLFQELIFFQITQISTIYN